MVASLSDIIEQYLKQLLHSSEEGRVDVQRNQLAEHFSCAPSQINYVLATRFLVEHGYLVETFRGGGGFVRITLLEFDPNRDWQQLIQSVGESIEQSKAEAIISRLLREQVITRREAALMKAVVQREVLAVTLPWRDALRANLMQAMLLALRRGE
ncbi:MAG: CtsR family transcriptional regulator [Bacillota bacterium]|jgi:transcriptional regulator CtsR